MYYFVLFFGIICFLSFVAWRFPAQMQAFAREARQAGRHGAQAAQPASDYVARWLQARGKEDRPCVTPVDCVQTGKCAGHCGWH